MIVTPYCDYHLPFAERLRICEHYGYSHMLIRSNEPEEHLRLLRESNIPYFLLGLNDSAIERSITGSDGKFIIGQDPGEMAKWYVLLDEHTLAPGWRTWDERGEVARAHLHFQQSYVLREYILGHIHAARRIEEQTGVRFGGWGGDVTLRQGDWHLPDNKTCTLADLTGERDSDYRGGSFATYTLGNQARYAYLRYVAQHWLEKFSSMTHRLWDPPVLIGHDWNLGEVVDSLAPLSPEERDWVRMDAYYVEASLEGVGADYLAINRQADHPPQWFLDLYQPWQLGCSAPRSWAATWEGASAIARVCMSRGGQFTIWNSPGTDTPWAVPLRAATSLAARWRAEQ